MSKRRMTTNERGKHSELLAELALTANGYKVLLPSSSTEVYDLGIRDGDNTYYIQVKTAYPRDEERYNGAWIVARGMRSNGTVYSKEDVDYFILVWDNKCYMFPNKEQQEYWFREWELEERTIPLSLEGN